jgi:outer membrane protein OmpA-like peptidoglycan-associated protein
MNSSGGKTPSTARPPAYKANALAMIRNELSQFANSGESSSSGQQSPQPPQNQQVDFTFRYQTFHADKTSLQSSSQQNIDRNVLLIHQMLSQVGVSGIEVRFHFSLPFLITSSEIKKCIKKFS